MDFPKTNKRIKTANPKIRPNLNKLCQDIGQNVVNGGNIIVCTVVNRKIARIMASQAMLHTVWQQYRFMTTMQRALFVHKLHEITMNFDSLSGVIVWCKIICLYVQCCRSIFTAYKLYNLHFDGHIRIICYHTDCDLGRKAFSQIGYKWEQMWHDYCNFSTFFSVNLNCLSVFSPWKCVTFLFFRIRFFSCANNFHAKFQMSLIWTDLIKTPTNWIK